MTKPSPERLFYTTQEAAQQLGVSTGTIRNWIASGLLEARQYAPRGPIRITVESVEKRMANAWKAHPDAPQP